jgi:DNA-binding CsgD family transcriptional regulator
MHQDFNLTEQESEVMYWMIRIVPVNIIAAKLHISEDIAIACCNRVFEKTKTENAGQLIILAIQKRIITVKEIQDWDLDSFLSLE